MHRQRNKVDDEVWYRIDCYMYRRVVKLYLNRETGWRDDRVAPLLNQVARGLCMCHV